MTIRGEKSIDEALAMTEKLGLDYGLEKKPVLHLRLLAEELFGMKRGISGDGAAEYKIIAEDKKFELHLKPAVDMTDELREKFIAVSSSKKNAAAVGITGKIRVLIADAMMSFKEAAPYASMSASSYVGNNGAVWIMSAYRTEVMKNANKNKEANEAWDELEKSVLAKVADDIKVSVLGNDVEIIIYKAF